MNSSRWVFDHVSVSFLFLVVSRACLWAVIRIRAIAAAAAADLPVCWVGVQTSSGDAAGGLGGGGGRDGSRLGQRRPFKILLVGNGDVFGDGDAVAERGG